MRESLTMSSALYSIAGCRLRTVASVGQEPSSLASNSIEVWCSWTPSGRHRHTLSRHSKRGGPFGLRFCGDSTSGKTNRGHLNVTELDVRACTTSDAPSGGEPNMRGTLNCNC